jgi:hypothetical protein
VEEGKSKVPEDSLTRAYDRKHFSDVVLHLMPFDSGPVQAVSKVGKMLWGDYINQKLRSVTLPNFKSNQLFLENP